MTETFASAASGDYRQLSEGEIIHTLESLQKRISERFPASGLSRVCGELLEIARECSERIERIQRPHWGVRAGVVAVVLAMIAIVIAVAVSLRYSPRVEGIADLIQAIDAGISEVVYLSVAIFFLVSLETRFKRREALAAIHELRSIAHIIDMHQLTKDPEQFLSPGTSTPSSPKRTMTRVQLARYLDYCSELLSLTSKIGALHGERFHDSVVLEAVSEVESLASSLSAKVWQKIMILDLVVPGDGKPEAQRGVRQQSPPLPSL